jgi:hypothetical protein
MRTTDAAHPTGVVVGVDGTPAGVHAAREASAVGSAAVA